MRRGEVWWARVPQPTGERPVVLLSRDSAYARRASATVAPITTRIRGIPVEVVLGSAEGLNAVSVVNLDNITTIPTDALDRVVGRLSAPKMREVEEAIRLALGLPNYQK